VRNCLKKKKKEKEKKKERKKKRAEGMDQVVKYLPSKWRALSSNLNTTKKIYIFIV
jgi:hypothetical protein